MGKEKRMRKSTIRDLPIPQWSANRDHPRRLTRLTNEDEDKIKKPERLLEFRLAPAYILFCDKRDDGLGLLQFPFHLKLKSQKTTKFFIQGDVYV